jgi:hypothetical protein
MQPEVSEPKNKKEFTAIEQWDMLAFKVIGNELVPKGFKTQKNGKYRGTEYVEVPKKAVTRTQKIGAQLVRGYRDKVLFDLNFKMAAYQGVIKTLNWWNWMAKAEMSSRIKEIQELIDLLNKTNIK